MQDFEKLGAFYLGKPFDPATQTSSDVPLLYASKDLVTHAVCVGMTGSGKTGLCIGLLEEAAIDSIPAIVIDPKGDLSNLLLTFPELRAEDFRPWISEDEARVKNVSVDEFAAQQAELWKKGLADWGEDGARIQLLKDAADFSIYTPGSDAGRSVSMLSSLAPPEPAILEDKELFRDRISGTAASLLSLVGISADSVTSREYVLLSAILEKAWRAGNTVDLPGLVAAIQDPGIEKIGAMTLETFYGAKERFDLALRINQVIASPDFQSWFEGEPLDIDALLHTAEGKPRVSIFSIAHLSDSERMFFIALLLNRILSWVRTQRGTGSLRALVYMDEIFGYFPPTANPPSKKPLLTLLKQARAYGVGIVLATQNPVDLDYKGLANTGTWFIGRLQTERDKMRVLDGLQSATGEAQTSFDRPTLDKLLSSLGKRVFVLNNVNENSPVLFQTRWTLSYLRGPLTREGIRELMKDRRPSLSTESAKPAADGLSIHEEGNARSFAAPVLPPAISQYFLPAQNAGTAQYRPVIIGAAKLRFVDDKLGIEQTKEVLLAAPLRDGPVPVSWEQAEVLALGLDELEKQPDGETAFLPLPAAATNAKKYASWTKEFVTFLYQSEKLELFESVSLNEMSRPDESERDFRIRLQQRAREERDRVAEALKQKYAPKLAALEERKRRAELAVAQQKEQVGQAMLQSALSVGAGLLGAFMGRKMLSASNISRAASAARQAGRTWKEGQDVGAASDTLARLTEQAGQLQQQFDDDLAAQQSKIDPASDSLEKVACRVKKTDITVQLVSLSWQPVALPEHSQSTL